MIFLVHYQFKQSEYTLCTILYYKLNNKSNLIELLHRRLLQLMHRQYDYIVKMVFIGSSAVGKSAIVKRFADNEYNQFYISTIGIDFRFKSVSIDDNYVKLQLWDTAGQERFKGITKSYYTNADVVIIVYDVNDSKTFDEIQSLWLNEAKTYCKNDVKIYVMCNKCDTPQAIKASHRKYLEDNEIEYFLVSAKTGKGVQQSIMAIASKMITIVPRAEQKTLSMELRESHYESGDSKKKKKCC